MSLALGDINASILQGLVTNMTDALATGESTAINAAHTELAGFYAQVNAAETQAGLIIQADLAPVVEQLKAFNAVAATLVGLFQQVRDGGLLLTIPKTVAPVANS